jgi:hypothetical protein
LPIYMLSSRAMSTPDPALQHAPATDAGRNPLRNYRHELFAQARAICLPLIEAARTAGYDGMTPGNAAKIDRMPKVRARIKYLIGNTEDAVRAKREAIERELQCVMLANMDDFVGYEVNETGTTRPILDLARIAALPEVERRQIMAAVKTVRYSDAGPTFELHGKLEAAAQLRALNGLDAPKRMELTGDRGAPLIPDVTDEQRAKALQVFLARKAEAGA